MKYDIIQVGAHVGTTLNDDHILTRIRENSKALFIEPIVEYFSLLKENYRKKFPRNRFNFLNVACSDHSGNLELYVPDIVTFSRETELWYIEKELPNWVDQLTSVYPNHVQDHHINVNSKLKVVPCMTLNEIFNKFAVTDVDYLAIDTEGHDFEALEGLDFNAVKPKEIRFEHKHIEGTNKSMGPKYNKLIDRLNTLGYIVTDIDSEDVTLIRK